MSILKSEYPRLRQGFLNQISIQFIIRKTIYPRTLQIKNLNYFVLK